MQFTPPHSQCSIHFGKGLTAAEPGSADRLILAVEDIDAARDDLISRGVDVSEVYESRPPGFESIEGRSYFTYASFSDPDGNGWLLQEITTRLPGRVEPAETGFVSAADLASALRRAASAHGEHEKRSGQADENWPDWYAAYMVAERAGEELPS